MAFQVPSCHGDQRAFPGMVRLPWRPTMARAYAEEEDGATDEWAQTRKRGKCWLNFKNKKLGLLEHQKSQKLNWSKIKSLRSFCNKDHLKTICNFVAVKRTKLLFLSFPRILWLGSKVIKSHKNILNLKFQI